VLSKTKHKESKAEGYSHFYKLSYHMLTVKKKINTNLHSFVKIEAEFSSSHIFSKHSFVSVQVKDSKENIRSEQSQICTQW